MRRNPVASLHCLLATLVAVVAFGAGSASAVESLRLLPGSLGGRVMDYHVRRGDSIGAIAVRFIVNPVRVTVPNRGALRDGLDTGETLHVDKRHITPRFPAELTGIVLNVPECEVYYVQAGKLVRQYPVAVSREDKPVPVGVTRVVSMDKFPTWYIPASIQKEMARRGLPVRTEVPPGPRNPLGPRYIGFWNGSFGFHGTNVPSSIKRYASHGCVRFLAHDIKDLYSRVHVGTPVYVEYQPVLLAAEGGTVWLSAFPDLYKWGYDYRGTVKRLAREAGVLEKLDWKAIARVIHDQTGIVTAVGKGDADEGAIVPPVPPLKPLFHKLPKLKHTPAPRPTLSTDTPVLDPVQPQPIEEKSPEPWFDQDSVPQGE